MRAPTFIFIIWIGDIDPSFADGHSLWKQTHMLFLHESLMVGYSKRIIQLLFILHAFRCELTPNWQSGKLTDNQHYFATLTPLWELGFRILLYKLWILVPAVRGTYWEWSGRPPSWGRHTGRQSVLRPGCRGRPCTPPPQPGSGPPTEASRKTQTHTRPAESLID